MRLATVQQCQDIEELLEQVYGLNSDVLMEAAGATAAREIDLNFFSELKRGQTSIVCGPGNNGGDGLVLARHLHPAGHRNLVIYILAPRDRRSKEFKNQLKRAELQGLRVVDLLAQPEKLEQIRSSSLIVDALFGIGLRSKIVGDYLRVVDVLNSTKVPTVSLDCPSGLNCDTGMVEGHAVKADMTLTFGLAKPGFFVGEGPQHLGKLRVLPIGFPYESLRGVATSHFLFTDKLARRYLPKRKELANKSDHGHLLLVAGNQGMWGAGVLASTAAYRVGAGYVTWASFIEPSENLKQIPEVLTSHLADESLWSSDKFTAVAVGPGLGVSQQTADFIERLKNQNWGPVVLDADAINTCVQFNLFPLPRHWILTPHAGELGRIIKSDARAIEKNRFEAAFQAAKVAGCYVLLKGFRTIIAQRGRCMVVHSGNSALAKAGTGDVLTGMIGGLLAQGVDVPQASGTAAYIHGRIADEWVRVGHDRRSLLASDLKDHLPILINRIASGALL